MTDPHRSNTDRTAERESLDSYALESHDLKRAVNDPTAWLVTGPSPHFVVSKTISDGWIQLTVQVKVDQPLQAILEFETANGIDPEHSITLSSPDGNLKVTRYLKQKISAKRIYFRLPATISGKIEMTKFVVEPISGPAMAVRSIVLKLQDIYSRGRIFPAIGYGLRLLAQGNLREFKSKFIRVITDAGSGKAISAQHTPEALYSAWRERTAIDARLREQIRRDISGMTTPPTISIIMFVDEPACFIKQAIESLKTQLYPHWELFLIPEPSCSRDSYAVLKEAAKSDARINFCPSIESPNVSGTLNSVLKSAKGAYIGLFHCHDLIPEHALYKFTREITSNDKIDAIYSDEDEIDASGKHVTPFFKPDWSPEYMQSCSYIGQMTLIRSELLRKVAESSETSKGSDIEFRALALTKNIKHIPDVLYHKRAEKEVGSLKQELGPKPRRTIYSISGRPKVSIIIPSTCLPQKGTSESMIERCINSVLNNTDYPNFEIMVLDRHSMPKEMEMRFQKQGIKRIPYDDPFNYSRVNNLGAKQANSEHLLFLNDDTEVINRDWLTSMLEYSQQPEIGAVGAKLLFPNGKVQHAGVVVLNGLPQHPFYLCDDEDSGYFNSLSAARNYIAVTGACLMTRKDVFDRVGGFDEFFPLSYNDVDYCIRVYLSGKRIVYTPHAKLIHHESVTRGKKLEASQINEFRKRWFEKFTCDPYYNPNLTQDDTNFAIASGDPAT